MLYFLIVLGILITVFSLIFFRRYTIIKIDGDSMLPTYKHGQFKIVDRFNSPENNSMFGELIEHGAILVFYSPSDYAVIKRLKSKVQISDDTYFYWFEGDNKENSKDSRFYGFITEDRIFGEVIDFSTFIKRTFTFKRSEITKEEKEYG